MGTVSIRQPAAIPETVDVVMSSVPDRSERTLPTRSASVAQLDRAAGFYPAGSGFESWRGRSVVVKDPGTPGDCALASA